MTDSERSAAEMHGLLGFARGLDLDHSTQSCDVTRVRHPLLYSSGMKLLAAYFRAKAQLCRELADTLAEQRNPIISKLRSMATEFDQNADVLEEQLARETLGEAVKVDIPDLH